MTREKVGEVWVDSGQIIIVDPGYLHDWEANSFDNEDPEDNSFSYAGACNTTLGVGGLYHGAFAVGRDHLAATMHTLVMAYVGTLLPLLLVLEAADVGVTDALNGQFLAEPAVATLVGSMALMASVPLTTILASLLAVRVPVTAIPAGHAHAH